MDELRQAWTVLGLKPGSTVKAVKARYRSLAKQWHPDRFGKDPKGQAEAALRMRMINDAYRCILEAAVALPKTADVATQPDLAPRGRRLLREEIERLVAAISTESWIESAGRVIWPTRPLLSAATVALVTLVGALAIVLLQWFGVQLSEDVVKYLAAVLAVLASVAGLLVLFWRYSGS